MTSSYKPMAAEKSCAEAWLSAVASLYDEGSINALILHIEDPASHSPTDDKIMQEVDDFLREHGTYPISTVANTIFPESLYTPGQRPKLYARYRRSFKKVKSKAPDWGRYFDRLIRWDRSDGEIQNQLETLISNLLKYGPQTDRSSPYYNMYEMTLFHPEKDATKPLGRQCLSFLEIKPEQTKEGVVLHMTALYRSHYYVAKTLGNLIGLGKLLRFIAMETNCRVGTLTIHSTHAELDTGKSVGCQKAWGKRNVLALIKRCQAIRQGGLDQNSSSVVDPDLA
tara:strand:- start:2286 stop:3131 length:846 start_codon:yes stop_codon:yes gene_type:complete